MEGETEAWRIARTAAAIALLAASALGATGRFRAALALTLGAAVAIVSALWLSDVVERLPALRPGAAVRLNWKFGLKAVLRYLVVGIALYLAVRCLAGEVPWLLGGLTTYVAAIAVEGVRDLRREGRDGTRT